jgi:hypothetical protein
MGFTEDIKSFSEKALSIKDKLQTEQATKFSLVVPLIKLLGYDPYDPTEVVPEYDANVPGTKKGDKVDLAIFLENKLSIIVEVKAVSDPLTSAMNSSQLHRYFGSTSAKYAIITNGILYKFFTDIQETNKLDSTPFLEFNLLDIKEAEIAGLGQFRKKNFNAEMLFAAASDLKHTNRIKELFGEELKEPKEEFVRYFMQGINAGRATQAAVDKFKVIVKKALNQHISDLMNDRFKAAMEGTGVAVAEKTTATSETHPSHEDEKKDIATTELEMEAFFLIKGMLRGTIESSRIAHKARVKFFNILLDNNPLKCICRLYLRDDKKYISFPHDQDNKMPLNDIDCIYGKKGNFVAAIDYIANKKDRTREPLKEPVPANSSTSETSIQNNGMTGSLASTVE